MSIVVEISSLNESQIKNIVDELTILPYNKKSKYQKYAPTKDPIQFFKVDPEKNLIYLPFKFGKLLTTQTNNNNSFSKLENPEFEMILYDYQEEIVTKALKHLKKTSATILGVPPGYGKTIMGAYLVYVKGLAACVFFDRKNIGDSWLETFRLCLPGLMNRLWYVGKKSKYPLPEGEETPLIILCMNKSWFKIPEYIRKTIGTLIIDEAHSFCSVGNVECLLSIQPKNIIIETATLQRDDRLEAMIYRMAGKTGIFKISNKPYIIYKINTGIKVEEFKNSQGVDSGRLYKDLSEHNYRNEIIIDILKNNKHKKFITLSKLTDHIEILNDMATDEDIEHSSFYGSDTDYNDSFALFGTFGKIGKGFDEARCCKNFKGRKSDTIIFCNSTPQWQIFEQGRGRVMRYDGTPIVIWFNDRNQMVKNHWRALENVELTNYSDSDEPVLVNWFEETNAEIIELDYQFGELILP